MPVAPFPQYPERTPVTYEVKAGVNPVRRGPMRFQEGVATDTDVPRDFMVGVMQGHQTDPRGRNVKVDTKYAEETLQERAHVGSAAWVEAVPMLGEFARGAFSGAAEVEFEVVRRGEGKQYYPNPATVWD